MSSQTYYDRKYEEEGTPLGLMNSLSDECTPLKHNYDRCFNTWFKDYLEVASSGNVNQSEQSSGSWTSGFPRLSSGTNRIEQRLSLLREQYEHDCGQLFSDYQACVRRALDEKGLNSAIEKARQENPFPMQHQR